MATELRLRPTGLQTTAAELGASPPGALRVAENVVLRRPGLIEPRPGCERATHAGGAAGTQTARAAFRYGDSLFAAARTSGDRRLYGPSAEVLDEAGAALAIVPRVYDATESRGSLFVVSRDQMHRLDDPASVATSRAGLPRALGGTTVDLTTGSTWLPDGDVAAYRVVYARGVGARTIFSTPSPRIYHHNDTGGAVGVSVTLVLAAGLRVGDRIQLYRAPAAVAYPNEPSDEMRLLVEHALTSDDLTLGTYKFEDRSPDDEWTGAVIYTAASQEGALQGNDRPWVARCVREYGGSLFFGGVRSPHRARLEFLSAAAIDTAGGGDPSAYFRSWGCFPVLPVGAAGAIPAGSTVIPVLAAAVTGASVWDFLRVGQFVSLTVGTTNDYLTTDSLFNASTQITAVNPGAGTITINNATLRAITAGGELIAVGDFLTIAGTTVYAGSTTATGSYPNPQIIQRLYSSTAPQKPRTPWAILNDIADRINRTNAVVHAYVIGNYAPPSDLGGDFPTLFVERRDGADTSFAMRSSCPGGWGGVRLSWNADAASTTDSAQHRLAWSKTQQPDHAPELNYVDIGDSRYPIERLARTRDALLVFKRDGVWRVTGFSPQSFRLDELDRSLRLVHPRALCEMTNAVAAWTNRGVVAITEGGASSLSDPIEESLEEIQAAFLDDDTAEGPFLAAAEHEGLLIFGCPENVGSGGADRIFVLATKTGAWTEWNFARWLMQDAVEIDGDIVLVGNDIGSDVLAKYTQRPRDTFASAPEQFCDATASGFIPGTTGAVPTLTLAAVSSLTAAASPGDLFIGAGGGLGIVTGVRTSPHELDVYVLNGNAAAFLGTGTLYEAPTKRVEWTAWSKDPASEQHWSELALHFQQIDAVRTLTIASRSERAPSFGAGLTITRTPATSRELPDQAVCSIERAAARCAQLITRIQIRQPGHFALGGARLRFAPLTEKGGLRR